MHRDRTGSVRGCADLILARAVPLLQRVVVRGDPLIIQVIVRNVEGQLLVFVYCVVKGLFKFVSQQPRPTFVGWAVAVSGNRLFAEARQPLCCVRSVAEKLRRFISGVNLLRQRA